MPRAPALAFALALAAGPAGAQFRASLDAGVSHVEYDDFLPSSAFSLSPSLRLAGDRAAVAARGTWLRFESGNHSLQGLLSGSFAVPTAGRTAVELGAEVGGSRYEGYGVPSNFEHVLGRGRLVFPGSEGPRGWLVASVGGAAFDGDGYTVMSLAGALRYARRDLAMTLTGTATMIGGGSYADLEARVRHARPGAFEAEAVVSARAGDPSDDPGPYLEASLTFPLTPYAAVVLAGGRYAQDLVRGNVAGRYVTAALRITAPFRRRPVIRVALPDTRTDDEAMVAAALVEVRRRPGQACTLTFRVAGAQSVEIMADFTDWVPLALERPEPDLWRVTLPITPGRHRLNLRVDGGPWGVPAGTTPVPDDFQGTAGALVVP